MCRGWRFWAALAAVQVAVRAADASAGRAAATTGPITCTEDGQIVRVVGPDGFAAGGGGIVKAPTQDVSCDFLVQPPRSAFAQLILTKYSVTSTGASLTVAKERDANATALEFGQHTTTLRYPLLATNLEPLRISWKVGGAVEGEKWEFEVRVRAIGSQHGPQDCEGGSLTPTGCVCDSGKMLVSSSCTAASPAQDVNWTPAGTANTNLRDAVARVVASGGGTVVLTAADPVSVLSSDSGACDIKIVNSGEASPRPTITLRGDGKVVLNLQSACRFLDVDGFNVDLQNLHINGSIDTFGSGSAVRIKNGNLFLNGVTFSHCAAARGGCVHADGARASIQSDGEAANVFERSLAAGDGGCAAATEGASLSLDNVAFRHCGSAGSRTKGATIYLSSPSSVKLSHVKIESSQRGSPSATVFGAVYAEGLAGSRSKFDLEHAVVRRNHLAAAAVFLEASPDSESHAISVHHAHFEDNTATLEGDSLEEEGLFSAAGALHIMRPGRKPSIENCAFRGNQGGGFGAVAIVDGGRDFVDFGKRFFFVSLGLVNCTFDGNRAAGAESGLPGAVGHGGAVYLGSRQGLPVHVSPMANCTFRNNSATASGGAVYAYGGQREDRKGNRGMFFPTNITFTKNRAGSGGAVYLRYDTTYATLRNVSYVGNVATEKGGGALFVSGGGVKWQESLSLYHSNAARHGGGGAVFMGGACDLCVFLNVNASKNTASLSGGFLSVASGGVRLNGFHLEGNSAGGTGGAIFADAVTSLQFMDGLVAKNTAQGAGGALFIETGNQFNDAAQVKNVAFVKNSAHNRGGADLSFDALAPVHLIMKNVSTQGGTAQPDRAGAASPRESSFVGAFRVLMPPSSSGHQSLLKVEAMACEGAAAGVGACLYVANAQVEMYDSTFADSTSDFIGGAIAAAGAAELTLVTVSVRNCTAGRMGGALALASGSRLDATGLTLERNKGGMSGGGIHVGSESWMDVSPDAQATEAYVIAFSRLFSAQQPASTLRIVDSTISENSADKGGGIRAQRIDGLDMGTTKVSKNAASTNGGGLWYSCRQVCTESVLLREGTAFEHNVAGGEAAEHSRGGAIFWAANRHSSVPASTKRATFRDNDASIGATTAGNPYKLTCGGRMACNSTTGVFRGVSIGEAFELTLTDYYNETIGGVNGLKASIALAPGQDGVEIQGETENATTDGVVSFTELTVTTKEKLDVVQFVVRPMQSDLMKADPNTDAENRDLWSEAEPITVTAAFNASVCPVGSALEEDPATKIKRCRRCEAPNEYALLGDTSRCYNCTAEGWDKGARCNGGVDVFIKKGYWRGPLSKSVFKCRRNTCEGGRDARCASGSEGPLCDLCEDAHFPAADGCSPCLPDKSQYTVTFVALLIGIHLAAAFVVNALRLTVGTVFSGSFRVIMNHVQTLGLIFFSTGFWPTPLYGLLDAMALSVQLPYSMSSYVCGVGKPMPTPEQVEFSTFLPLYVIGLGAAPFLFTAFRKVIIPCCSGKKNPVARMKRAAEKRRKRKERDQRRKDREARRAAKGAGDTVNPLAAAGVGEEKETVNPLAAHSSSGEKETVNPLAAAQDEKELDDDYEFTSSSGAESDFMSEPPSEDEAADAQTKAGAAAGAEGPGTKKKRRRIKRKELIRFKKLMHAAFVLLALVFPIVARFSFMAYGCVEVDTSTGRKVLYSDYSVECNSDDHKRMQAAAMASFVIIVVGLPLFALTTQIVWKPSRWLSILYLLKCGCVQPGEADGPSQPGNDAPPTPGPQGRPASARLTRTISSFKGWKLERDPERLLDQTPSLRRIVRKATIANAIGKQGRAGGLAVLDRAAIGDDDGPSLMKIGAAMRAEKKEAGAGASILSALRAARGPARPQGPRPAARTQEFRNPTFDAPSDTPNPLMQQQTMAAPSLQALRAIGARPPRGGAALPRGGAALPRGGPRPMAVRPPAVSATAAGMAARPVAAAIPGAVARPGMAARMAMARPGMAVAARPGMAAHVAAPRALASTAVASQGAAAATARPVASPQSTAVPSMAGTPVKPATAVPVQQGAPPGTSAAPAATAGAAAAGGPPGVARGPPGVARGPPGVARGPPGVGGGPSADKPVGGDGIEVTMRQDRESSRLIISRRKPEKKTWYHRYTRSTCLIVEYLEEDYDDAYWFWESVVYIRKIAVAILVSTVGVSTGSTSVGASLLLLFLLGALVIHVFYNPYKFGVCNSLETVSLIICTLSAWNGLLSTLEEPLAGPMAYVLFVANIIVLAALAGISLLDLYMSGTMSAILSRVCAVCLKPKKVEHVQTRYGDYDGTKYLRYGGEDQESLVVEETRPLIASSDEEGE